MYSFFVLGLIPGTDWQITFQLWLYCILLPVEIGGLAWLYHRHSTQLKRCVLACLNEARQGQLQLAALMFRLRIGLFHYQ